VSGIYCTGAFERNIRKEIYNACFPSNAYILVTSRVPIRPVFPGTVPFFIQMSRVNFKSPAFSKYPSVLLINAIWTDETNRLKIETV
jgi:hypothetical protein